MLSRPRFSAMALALLCMQQAGAVETKINGVIDYRLSHTDSSDSYRQGGVGKFGTSSGSQGYLGQGGLQLVLDWESGWSLHTVANAYKDGDDDGIGITEAFFKYKGVPDEDGTRWSSRVGIFYPEISLENRAFAWATTHTLNASTINTWVGEEVRLLGAELGWTQLGKLNDRDYDLSFSAAAFTNNDPNGALLAWHGWTSSSRQTLWGEQRAIPPIRARQPGFQLELQADNSDPFLELDDRLGFHLNSKVKWRRKGEVNFGYYNNNAQLNIVVNGQYTWHTRFLYAGARWLLGDNLEFSTQIMHGDTVMNDPQGIPVVDNDFQSAYVMLSKRWDKHRVTGRLEEFFVNDKDQTVGDNNDEYGKAATLNYTYRYSKPLFLSVEHNWIDSDRHGRTYAGEPASRLEKQLLFAVRYFF